MNNDRPPAVKLRKWLMRNKESTLPGLTKREKLYDAADSVIFLTCLSFLSYRDIVDLE